MCVELPQKRSDIPHANLNYYFKQNFLKPFEKNVKRWGWGWGFINTIQLKERNSRQ